jgi:hypothetical protein
MAENLAIRALLIKFKILKLIANKFDSVTMFSYLRSAIAAIQNENEFNKTNNILDIIELFLQQKQRSLSFEFLVI